MLTSSTSCPASPIPTRSFGFVFFRAVTKFLAVLSYSSAVRPSTSSVGKLSRSEGRFAIVASWRRVWEILIVGVGMEAVVNITQWGARANSR
jgi:hypothetical protein